MTVFKQVLGEWHGQKIVFPGITELFGKRYVWMQDHDGTIYLTRLDENDVPKFE